MAYRYHPEIPGLKANEDGTTILLDGNKVRVGQSKRGFKYIIYNTKTIGVARLVCECWHGVAPSHKHSVKRNKPNSDHYKNLSWSIHGGNRKFTVKLSENDHKEIERRILKGDKQIDIAKDYDVSANHISRLKKKLKTKG